MHHTAMDVVKTKSRMQTGDHKSGNCLSKLASQELVQWIWKMVRQSNKRICRWKCIERRNETRSGAVHGKSKLTNVFTRSNHQLWNISKLFRYFECIWSRFTLVRRRPSTEKLRKSNVQCSNGSENKTTSFVVWNTDPEWFDWIFQFDSFR